MRLSVNIDHIATIRQARKVREPDPVTAAGFAELAGAEGITVHLRGDRRHIHDRDVELLRQVVQTKLNVEMAATSEMIEIAERIRPDQVTLVPERPQEVTTEGGLDVASAVASLTAPVRRLREAGIRVSMFIDCHGRQVEGSREAGADAVEFNTGPYTTARGEERQRQLDLLAQMARLADGHGLEVLAGHGLNYVNVRAVVAIPEIVELNIGHAIVARAAFVGLDHAVREMVSLLER